MKDYNEHAAEKIYEELGDCSKHEFYWEIWKDGVKNHFTKQLTLSNTLEQFKNAAALIANGLKHVGTGIAFLVFAPIFLLFLPFWILVYQALKLREGWQAYKKYLEDKK